MNNNAASPTSACCSVSGPRACPQGGGDDGPSLLAHLLFQQSQLTAVERFARAHTNGGIPAPAERYARLLPAAPPGPGQQYAFEVDLDRCSGCKACVTACHALNGLDQHETWRDVGLLVGGTNDNPLLQHVTAACHHCLEPACMIGCPVDAYEKDPHTGIVKHLDDQCIGCRYCTLACPYDVPKYHAGKGIVRKCDMCSDRLAAGEPPACAQACPQQAISIRVVDAAQVIEDAEAGPYLPAAPDPHITLPTTTYRTSRVLPRNALPADYHRVSRQHAHWPLVIMLVLTQLSVGAFLTGAVLEGQLASAGEAASPARQAGSLPYGTFHSLQSTGGLLFGLVALAASVFHLGRPQFAFRAVIGLKHSWLSREILAFGVFATLAGASAVVSWTSAAAASTASEILTIAVGASGLGGVFCSAMIYQFTRRPCWSAGRTLTRFLMTTALLGIAATWLTTLGLAVLSDGASAGGLFAPSGGPLARALIAVSLTKLLWEALQFVHLLDRRHTPHKRAARLMAGELSNPTLARFACGILGGIAMPLLLLMQSSRPASGSGALVLTIAVAILFVACLAGELLERYLFFAAAAAPGMPGGIRG